MTDHGEPSTERARRLDAAQRVAKGMLHEFRNILNPIVSAAYLMHANANDPAKVRELATRIEGFARADDRVAKKMRELLEREASGEHP
jgi:signal transduction histidine kinase